MKLKWYGHSCFLLTSESGFRILTDPCDDSTGYHLSGIEADLVTSSHDHFDHNYFAAVVGDPPRITEPGEYEEGGVKITGIPAWHDDQGGALRGRNIIFVFEIDGMRVAHLGDLGHMPDAATIAAIGDLDVLLSPVGGTFTIEQDVTREIANATHANVLVPMHYKTDVLNFDIKGVQPLLTNAKDCTVHRLKESECVLTKENLGTARIVVLDYTR